MGLGLWLSGSSCQVNNNAFRTASKPLASRFQSYVLAHPTLRPAVLRFAQVTHMIVTNCRGQSEISSYK